MLSLFAIHDFRFSVMKKKLLTTMSGCHTVALLKQRRVRPNELPKDLSAVVLVHDPEDPCGIMTLSNLTTSQRGNFTNTRRDLFSNREGLWSNGMFNTPGSTIDRGVSTFSNLHVCHFVSSRSYVQEVEIWGLGLNCRGKTRNFDFRMGSGQRCCTPTQFF